MADIPVDAQKLFANNIMSDGIIMVEHLDRRITLDLYLIVKPEFNMIEVAKQVQEVVKRALFEIVGVEQTTINIHIENVAPIPASLPASKAN